MNTAAPRDSFSAPDTMASPTSELATTSSDTVLDKARIPEMAPFTGATPHAAGDPVEVDGTVNRYGSVSLGSKAAPLFQGCRA